jgi:lysophosphatidic acid acyltransferase / lysophosphatidylinositol acyltransferase
MNHCYEIDWLVGWHILEKKHMLGSGRGFVKNVIKYIPIAGWFFGLSEHIFLQRSYEKDKQVIEESLQDILNYPDNAFVVMTAEGTRFTKEKHEASVKFAKERNIQPLKHHLMPRPKGFMTCVPILKENQAKVTVLNYQLAYNPKDKVEPTLLNLLRGEKVTSHVYLSVIPMEQIDATPESLINVYREKDELHESFMKYGNFYEGRNMKPIEGVKQKPRIGVLINGIFWFILNFSFMMYYATHLILAGRLVFLLSVSSAIITLCKLFIMCSNM